MTLPGKLCVGILEEDNPLKSYFRFKPMLVSEEGGYRPFSAGEAFPEEGCLRIVPDKNESGHFKARMRRIGRYAMLDLRAHAGENDKIRPNKNYHADPAENNAYIVYSDVVVEPPSGALFEIVDRAVPEDSTHMALTMPLPGTQRVLFRGEEGVSPALWRVAPMEDVEGAVELSREEACVRPGAGAEFAFPAASGEMVNVLIAPPGASLLEGEEVAEAPAQAEEPPAAPAAPPRPAQPEKPRAQEVPAPREGGRSRLNARAQAIALQTGLNPRRSRSLQEIIDDKWRRSRIDQLGHPVPGEATGMPVQSPVERAVDALRVAWRIEEARPALAEAVCSLDGLGVAVQSRADVRADEARTRRLNELEAQRLRLLNEVGALEARREDARERLLEDMRRQSARDLAEAEQKLDALRADIAACEERAKGARVALAEAESAYADAERRLARRAVENSAMRFLRAPAVHIPVDEARPSAGELIADVRTRLAGAGLEIAHDRAVELLAALTHAPILVLCGSAFAPKAELARALAGALGLGERFLSLSCPPRQERALDALLCDEASPVPALILMEECNAPGREAQERALRLRMNALGAAHPARLALTACDDGLALPVELLDAAFLLRLEPEAADAPWHPQAEATAACAGGISLDALRGIFRPEPEAVGEEARERMERLRQELARCGVRMSRRTLDAVWALCASIAPLLREHAPLQALDIALARRALPAILASAPLEALRALPEMVADMEECQKLLESPLPIF